MEVFKAALRKAFITLAEGEGYLLGVTPGTSEAAKRSHTRVCALFAQSRGQVEEALSMRLPPAAVHARKATQTSLFDDSEL